MSLGPNYRKLWTASAISNLGDGIDSTALPLLAAALTRDPILFSGVAVAGRLPWLLFALQAGAIADRVDRRRLMVGVNVVRFVLLGALAATVALDLANIWILYAVSFGLGVGEVLFDNTAQALLPSLVKRDDLETANGRLFGVEIVANQFVGPPLGGFLFAIAAAVPLALDAGTFLVAGGLIAWLAGTFRVERSVAIQDRRLRDEIKEGLSWLWQHRLLRALGLLLGLMNGLSMAGFAILALYALEVLGLNEIGFGILATTSAVGSVLASLVAGRVVKQFGRGPVLIATILGNGATMLVIGLTSNAIVTGAMMALFGFFAVAWNVITVYHPRPSARQGQQRLPVPRLGIDPGGRGSRWSAGRFLRPAQPVPARGRRADRRDPGGAPRGQHASHRERPPGSRRRHPADRRCVTDYEALPSPSSGPPTSAKKHAEG